VLVKDRRHSIAESGEVNSQHRLIVIEGDGVDQSGSRVTNGRIRGAVFKVSRQSIRVSTLRS